MPATGRHPYFRPDEFAHRVERVKERMRAARVEIALFDEIEAMTWLSGYGNSENRWRCVGIPLEGEPFFLIRALDAGPCRSRTWISDVVTFRDWEDQFAPLIASLNSRRMLQSRIGLDFNSYSMNLVRFAGLKSALSRATFVDLGPVVNELRLIKSPAEVELLRKAAMIADEAMRRSSAACVPGATQRKAAAVAAATFIDLGADPSHPGPIAAGRGWDFLHAELEDAPLKTGDLVHLELVPRIFGYCSRVMRCVSLGAPSLQLTKAAERLVYLQDKQIAAMRPGALAHDVDAILREGVLKAGLRDSFDNISGYTLGLYAQAGPRTSDFTRTFHPGADWRLEQGMVFHMYASARGASFSETVLVVANGPERLSRLPRTLIVNA
jgi:Xaa-Pro aminopeptidase